MSFILAISITLVLSTLNFLPTSQHLIAKTDRLALLAFKAKINDPSGILSSWNESSHYSNWTGITCSRRHPNRVTVLDLRSRSLGGLISPYIGNLSFLQVLALSENHLTGEIPQEIGQLSRLKILEISMNNIFGLIPQKIFNISSITVFGLTGNKLHGSIPPYIGDTLPNLQFLLIGDNRFHGLLPLSNLSRLAQLDVGENQFTGPVPTNLGSLQDLKFLNLESNRLGTGKVDDLSFLDSLSNCSHLEVLSFSSNKLSGQLPDTITNLSTKLTELYMGENKIFGEIPSGIENLISLNRLSMAVNRLTGSIPDSLGKLTNLLDVALADNQLSGHIPANICNNTQLERLFLDKNRLEGNIPPSLGSCGNLRVLGLSMNQLVGTIPKHVIGLSSLSIQLSLSWNHLTGNLPSEVGNLERIVFLDLSNNQLSGELPGSLKHCLGLQELWLNGNLFEGIIPPSLKSLKGIQTLDISSNNLSGRIPEYLESFASLGYLNVSFNDFEGELPKQGIFKRLSTSLVSGNEKLCGGIPRLHLPSCPRPAGSKRLSKRPPLKRLLLIIFGTVICIILLGSFLIWIWRRKTTERSSSSLGDPVNNKFQKVSYKELLKATDGFLVENLVGVGSYGSVYKGLLMLNQETTVVAVKVLDLQRRGASKSFVAECDAMRSIRHRNLVKMLTSCSSIDFKGNDFKALVSEFMPNGSLEYLLHPTEDREQLQRSSRRSLTFMERLNVAIDVASALDYLHQHCQTPIVHCDLKPSNVLLDDKMNAHVGDFGLAKFLGGFIINVEAENHTNSTSVGIRGSIGYAAPEYGMGSEVSTNGDVYSYGILVLEMFTAKRPTDVMFADGLTLHTFAKRALLPDRVMHIDPTMQVSHIRNGGNDDNDEIVINGENEAKLCEALTGIISLAIMCSVESPSERMEIAQVVKELQSIKTVYLSSVRSQ